MSSDSVATWSSHGRVTCLNRLNSGNEVDEGSLVVSEIGPAVRGTPSYVNGHRRVFAA